VKGAEQQKTVQGLLKQGAAEFLLLQGVGCARNYKRRKKPILFSKIYQYSSY